MEHVYSVQPDAIKDTVTPEEANEVLRIWAERQKQAAHTANQTSVADISEALNISPEEVAHILHQVRMTPEKVKQVVPSERRARKILLALGIAVLCMMVLGMLATFSRGISESQPVVIESITPMATVTPDTAVMTSGGLLAWPFETKIDKLTYSADQNQQLPHGGSILEQEEALAADLAGRIEVIWPTASLPKFDYQGDVAVITRDIRFKNSVTGVRYVDVSLTHRGQTVTEKVPVLGLYNPNVAAAVRICQPEALRSLANQALTRLGPDYPLPASELR